jgi:hypothetical protein
MGQAIPTSMTATEEHFGWPFLYRKTIPVLTGTG